MIAACTDGPRVGITSPLPDQVFLVGDTVWFQAGVNSPEPLGIEVSGDFLWSSDLDGALGERALFFRLDLTPGEHLVTLRVRNRRDVVLRDQVRFFVGNQE